jgi:hypothetical protein
MFCKHNRTAKGGKLSEAKHNGNKFNNMGVPSFH